MSNVKSYLSLIKFSHTIFALPFAIVGMLLAVQIYDESLNWTLFALVVLCMVFARSAAMSFNRYIDRDIDAKNPRTQMREIPSGQISPKKALAFTIISSLLFILATYFINPICFYLSPIALLVVLGYSYTKRFTALCHLVLGLGLALAPIGAFLAVSGEFHIAPLYLSLAVLTWVGGFDIIYALQDIEFDTKMNLNSIPQKLGIKNSVWLSRILHFISAFSLLMVGVTLSVTVFYWVGCAIFIALLIYQHRIVRMGDLSKINLAFFTSNGIASIVFCLFFVLDFFLA